jgi:hypothetical protein
MLAHDRVDLVRHLPLVGGELCDRLRERLVEVLLLCDACSAAAAFIAARSALNPLFVLFLVSAMTTLSAGASPTPQDRPSIADRRLLLSVLAQLAQPRSGQFVAWELPAQLRLQHCGRVADRPRRGLPSYCWVSCVRCAMAAATGATGARTWLQVYALHWLTPKRLRADDCRFAAALLVSTVGFSGSSTSAHPAVPAQGGAVMKVQWTMPPPERRW